MKPLRIWLAGPGTVGTWLAGQGVLSDIIAVASRGVQIGGATGRRSRPRHAGIMRRRSASRDFPAAWLENSVGRYSARSPAMRRV